MSSTTTSPDTARRQRSACSPGRSSRPCSASRTSVTWTSATPRGDRRERQQGIRRRPGPVALRRFGLASEGADSPPLARRGQPVHVGDVHMLRFASARAERTRSCGAHWVSGPAHLRSCREDPAARVETSDHCDSPPLARRGPIAREVPGFHLRLTSARAERTLLLRPEVRPVSSASCAQYDHTGSDCATLIQVSRVCAPAHTAVQKVVPGRRGRTFPTWSRAVARPRPALLPPSRTDQAANG